MASPIISWNCLIYTEKSPEQPTLTLNLMNTKSLQSFVDVVNNVCDIPLSQFLKPCVKGDRIAIPISEEEYQLGLKAGKHNLHGRVIWPKGSTPLTLVVAALNKAIYLLEIIRKVGNHILRERLL